MRDVIRNPVGKALVLAAGYAPLLIAATPLAIQPAVPPTKVVRTAEAPVTRAFVPAELAGWAALSIGTGVIVLSSRRRRRIATA
jgi:hypothetical protein